MITDSEDRQQALVVFAGDAFVVAPFTDDDETLKNLIPSLNTLTSPVQGSRSDLGLRLAKELIENTDAPNVQVVLMTDGVSRGEFIRGFRTGGLPAIGLMCLASVPRKAHRFP